VAIDGKVLRRSFDRASGKSALHMVSAWGCEQRLVLAQIPTDAKSNEITAVPKLLAMLSLKGMIVTTDALNCQRTIPSSGYSNGLAVGTLASLAQQIVDQGGDYALALKGNQNTLHDDVVRFFDDSASKITTAKPNVDGDHGRIETRTATVSTEIEWLQNTHRWPGLKAIGKVERVRESAAKTSTEMAYYLLSAPLSPERLNEVVRSHWGVENQLHWRLDVVMNEDQDRTRLGNGPETSPFSAIWPSTQCRKRGQRAPCEASSSEPAGTTPFSPGFWRCSEMRLPCLLPWVRSIDGCRRA
jgi:predicted transposase YbfD/YdcC